MNTRKCKYGIHPICKGSICKYAEREVGCVLEADDTTTGKVNQLRKEIDEQLQDMIALSMRLSELTWNTEYDELTDCLKEAVQKLNEIDK